MSRPQPLSPDEATKKIRDIAVNGTVKFSTHLMQDRMKMRSVTTNDILYLLETGSVIKPAKWDERFCDWKYGMEGVDLNGDELTAITVIFNITYSVLIVTVIGD